MQTSRVRAVLFAVDLERVATFYAEALDLQLASRDERHASLHCQGFELIVHQIPPAIAAGIEPPDPPVRRSGGGIRLDYPVASIESSRARARRLGGTIDSEPPEWAGRDENFCLGHDPEGNVFGVSEVVL